MLKNIPEGWLNGHLEDFLILQRGYDITEKEAEDGDIPVVSSSGISYYHNESKVQPPGVVTGRKGILGKVHYLKVPYWPHDTTLWIRDFKGNDALFSKYYLEWFNLSRFDAATSVPTLNRNIVHGQRIIFPPIAEQRKIAEILSTWDEAIDLTEQLIAAKLRRKQALMQRLLTGKVRFPGFEEKWEKIALGDVTTKIGSGVTPKGGSKSYLAAGIPLIRSQNVLIGRLDLADVAFISGEQHEKMSATKLNADDVLLNITGASIGRSCVVPTDFAEGNVNQHVCIIRPTEQLNSTFLAAFLNSTMGQRQVDAFQAGGNRQGLNFAQIRSFKIPLPIVEEQEKIAQLLQTCDQEIDLFQQKLAALRQQKQGLMQQLLTGKIRVKV